MVALFYIHILRARFVSHLPLDAFALMVFTSTFRIDIVVLFCEKAVLRDEVHVEAVSSKVAIPVVFRGQAEHHRREAPRLRSSL